MAKPFLKWAGGKRRLVPELLKHVPANIRTYREPFLGGGALFFELQQRGVFDRAVLSDINQELVTTYRVVRDVPDELIRALSSLSNTEAEFYAIRSARPTGDIEVAARMIYLNKTCFNGLYRVNRSGGFNSPFGKYKNPKICDDECILAASAALENTSIGCHGFEESLREAAPGDFAYLDPPYVAASKTANFVAYHASGFGPEKQTKLWRTFQDLERRGVSALLSNSDTEDTRKLYNSQNVRAIQAARAINSKSSKRGPVGELLVYMVDPNA